MPKVTANGILLHYLQSGKGPDVVMLHGNGGNLAVWHLQLVGMLKDQFHMTTYDLRGHGKSEMPATGYTSKDQAEDLCGLLDALGIEKAHVLGHSFGADVAMHFAVLYPDRADRLVVIEPNIAALIELRQDKGWEGWAYWAARLEEETGIAVPKDKWADTDYMLRRTLDIPIRYGPFKGRMRNRDWMLRLLETTTLVEDYQKVAGLHLERIEQISNPMLAIYGNTSHFCVTYEFFRDRVPNCETVMLSNSDHYGPLEQPELISKELERFFLGPAPARATDAPSGRIDTM